MLRREGQIGQYVGFRVIQQLGQLGEATTEAVGDSPPLLTGGLRITNAIGIDPGDVFTGFQMIRLW